MMLLELELLKYTRNIPNNRQLILLIMSLASFHLEYILYVLIVGMNSRLSFIGMLRILEFVTYISNQERQGLTGRLNDHIEPMTPNSINWVLSPV